MGSIRYRDPARAYNSWLCVYCPVDVKSNSFLAYEGVERGFEIMGYLSDLIREVAEDLGISYGEAEDFLSDNDDEEFSLRGNVEDDD